MTEITVNNKQDFIKLLDYTIDLADELNESLDTTEYLLKSEANKKRLMDSISQVKSSIKTTQEVYEGGYSDGYDQGYHNCMFDRGIE